MAKNNKKTNKQNIKVENLSEVTSAEEKEVQTTENADFATRVVNFIKNKNFLLGAAAFLLPALVLYGVFVINGLHPFGNGQILVTDLWHQYYPFLCELQERLKEGQSLLYSENIGMGINFLALIAYYCASPLNFLIMLVSKESLRDLVAVIVALKAGFSGLFFSLYLKKVNKRYEFSTIAFSALYALCGYMLGYYWNIMWLDCVALLPLVMLGVYSLIKENKCILYIVSLAIAVISNFYIGFMLCIFTAIYFFSQCIIEKLKIKEFFIKLGMIAVASIISLAMTAFITVPTYLALGQTVAAEPKDEQEEQTLSEKIGEYYDEFKEDAVHVLGRTASFGEPNPKEEGIVNAFSGLISVILFGYFLCSDKIGKREKLTTTAVILIMFLSMVFNDIDIIWHGFHKPNMVPFRYAFIFSFVMIAMAYRTYVAEFTDFSVGRRKKKFPLAFVISALITILVIVCANKEAVIGTVIGSCVLAVLYYVMIESFHDEPGAKMKQKWATTLCGFIVAEVVINTIIAVPTVRITVYDTYYYRGEEIENLLEEVDADSSYGRVETSQDYILNDPALYGYKGVSTFTSTADADVSEFIKTLGICGIPGSNRYYYETTSPLTNAFLGIEHVIFKNDMDNHNPYLVKVATETTNYKNDEGEDRKTYQHIYKNTQSLPIGFMTANSLLDEEGIVGNNAFEKQNDLFRKATGLDGDLYTKVPFVSEDGEEKYYYVEGNVGVSGTAQDGSFTIRRGASEDKPQVKFIVNVENDVPLYAYVMGRYFNKVTVDGTDYKMQARGYILPIGVYEEGQAKFDYTFDSSFEDSGRLTFMIYKLDTALFEEGMALLRDEGFEITKYESTVVEGNIEAKEDGVFYTSIPYDEGWTLYVDGEETEIKPLENAMICVPLTKGEHDIVLKYSPVGFVPGVIVSIVALVIFIGAIVLAIMIKRKKKNG